MCVLGEREDGMIVGCQGGRCVCGKTKLILK